MTQGVDKRNKELDEEIESMDLDGVEENETRN